MKERAVKDIPKARGDDKQTSHADKEEVGYKKPPKKHQFKKGKSGNPKGRPNKPKCLDRAVFEALHKPKTVIVGGKPTKMPGVDVLAAKLVTGALELQKPALSEVLSIVGKVEAEEAQMEAAAAVAAKKAIENPPFSWTEERQKLLDELNAATLEMEHGHEQ